MADRGNGLRLWECRARAGRPVAGLHVPLILLVPWGGRWVAALAIAAIDSLDFCLILWVLSFVGDLAGGPGEGHRTA